VEFPSVGITGVFFCAFHPGVVDTSILESIEVSEDTGCWRDGGCSVIECLRSVDGVQDGVFCTFSGLGFVVEDEVSGWGDGMGGSGCGGAEGSCGGGTGVLMFTMGVDGWVFL
jgi:hypothetical protein